MKRCTAFVLGGGGSHGALQVGALRAFMEAGIAPDLLVGSSIGAVNAAGIALWGYNPDGFRTLEQAWSRVLAAQLLDGRVSQLVLRALLGRPSDRARKKAEEFFISLGLTHDLKFGGIGKIRVAMVSADLETGHPIIFGSDPEESILESMLTSIAIPPWFQPFSREGHILLDGGVLSNVPIEPAVTLGASEVYAFDLNDCDKKHFDNPSATQYLQKYFQAISQRTLELETVCAEMQGIPVHRLTFTGLAHTAIYDFSSQKEMIASGYERAKHVLAEWAGGSSVEDEN